MLECQIDAFELGDSCLISGETDVTVKGDHGCYVIDVGLESVVDLQVLNTELIQIEYNAGTLVLACRDCLVRLIDLSQEWIVLQEPLIAL